MFTDINKTIHNKKTEEFTGNIEKKDNSALSLLQDTFVPDNEKGISQENLEGLRAEFVSLGGMVTTLPEVSSVRDFTQLVLKTGNLRELYMMVEGKWEFLRRLDSQDHIADASGTLANAITRINLILVVLENIKELKTE